LVYVLGLMLGLKIFDAPSLTRFGDLLGFFQPNRPKGVLVVYSQPEGFVLGAQLGGTV
jgi:hypothetical protein